VEIFTGLGLSRGSFLGSGDFLLEKFSTGESFAGEIFHLGGEISGKDLPLREISAMT
jgi:hypothetical protein